MRRFLEFIRDRVSGKIDRLPRHVFELHPVGRTRLIHDDLPQQKRRGARVGIAESGVAIGGIFKPRRREVGHGEAAVRLHRERRALRHGLDLHAADLRAVSGGENDRVAVGEREARVKLTLGAVLAGGEDHRILARRKRQRRDLPFVRHVRIVREIPARKINARLAEVCDLDPVGEVAVAVGERAAVLRHDLGDVNFVVFVAAGAQPRLIPRVVVGISRRRAVRHRPFAVFLGIGRVLLQHRQLHALALRAGGRCEHDRFPARARQRKGRIFRALHAGGAPYDLIFARAEHFVREGVLRFVRAVRELVAGERYRRIRGVMYLDPVVEIPVGRGIERV